MSREFIMGARLQLQDQFSGVVRQALRTTEQLKQSVVKTDHAVDSWTASNGRLRTSLSNAANAGRNFERQTNEQAKAATSLREGLFSLKGMVTAVAGSMAATKGYDWLIGANADMEQYQNTLTVVMKSSEKAKETLAWAQDFSAKTPFEIPQVVEATTRLSAYGLEAKKVLGITGDMASVMGKDLMQAVEAVSDARTGELERLKEFGITKDMIDQTAKNMGMSVINNKGQITDTAAFNGALFKLMEERFKGGMDMQSKTWKGMISNAKDFMGTFGRELGKPLFEKLSIQLEKLMTYLNQLKESGKIDEFMNNLQSGASVTWAIFKSVVGFIIKYHEVLIPLVAGLLAYKTVITAVALKTQVWSAVMALTPVGQVALAIGLLVAAGVALYRNWDVVRKKTGELWDKLGAFKGVAILVLGPIGQIIRAAVTIRENWDSTKSVWENVWNGIKLAASNSVNEVITSINKMIEFINRIPGVNVPIVPKVSWGEEKVKAPQGMADFRKIDGSHATGLTRVPFDGYIAELHKDERVLTASEARSLDRVGTLRSGGVNASRGDINVQQIVLNDVGNKDTDALTDELLGKFYDRIATADEILSNGDKAVLL